MRRLGLWFWFSVLRTLDTLFPEWSKPGPPHADYVSREAIYYWTTDERCRRTEQ